MSTFTPVGPSTERSTPKFSAIIPEMAKEPLAELFFGENFPCGVVREHNEVSSAKKPVSRMVTSTTYSRVQSFCNPGDRSSDRQGECVIRVSVAEESNAVR